jgi:hypothetical protein
MLDMRWNSLDWGDIAHTILSSAVHAGPTVPLPNRAPVPSTGQL